MPRPKRPTGPPDVDPLLVGAPSQEELSSQIQALVTAPSIGRNSGRARPEPPPAEKVDMDTRVHRVDDCRWHVRLADMAIPGWTPEPIHLLCEVEWTSDGHFQVQVLTAVKTTPPSPELTQVPLYLLPEYVRYVQHMAVWAVVSRWVRGVVQEVVE